MYIFDTETNIRRVLNSQEIGYHSSFFIRNLLTTSYVPQHIAVDGTFIVILGYIPLPKAVIPSLAYINWIVYTTFRYFVLLTSKPQASNFTEPFPIYFLQSPGLAAFSLAYSYYFYPICLRSKLSDLR